VDPTSDLGASGRLFDLDAIAAALDIPTPERSADEGTVERRMLHGYAFVDELVTAGRDPFVYGGSGLLIEMNHIVLCGTSPARRAEFGPHIAATERRFFDDHECGADSFYDWVALNRQLTPLAFAARAYRRIVGAPQLFIEGNQRTATLVASYVLGRAGLPPLVRTADHAKEFAALSSACKAIDRRQIWSAIQGRILDWRLQRFMARSAVPVFLARDQGSTASPANRLVPRAGVSR